MRSPLLLLGYRLAHQMNGAHLIRYFGSGPFAGRTANDFLAGRLPLPRMAVSRIPLASGADFRLVFPRVQLPGTSVNLRRTRTQQFRGPDPGCSFCSLPRRKRSFASISKNGKSVKGRRSVFLIGLYKIPARLSSSSNPSGI